MTRVQFLLLVALLHTAPRVSDVTAAVITVVAMFLAFVFMGIDR